MADLRVLATARQSLDCLRVAVRNRPLRGSRPIGKRIRRSESECRAQLGSSESHPSRCRPESKPRLAFSTTREGAAGRSSLAPAHSPVPPASAIANPRRPAASLPASASLLPFAPSRARALSRPPRTGPASFARPLAAPSGFASLRQPDAFGTGEFCSLLTSLRAFPLAPHCAYPCAILPRP